MLIVFEKLAILQYLLRVIRTQMMNPSCSQRLKRIRDKIQSMKSIDPNSLITKEQLEELKRNHKIPERGIIHSGRVQGNRVENAAPEGREELRQPLPVKKIFAFDTPFYRNFHSKYEKEELKAPNAQKIESNVEPVPIGKQNLETGEIEKKATIQINPPTESSGLIKLVPVNQSEDAVEKEKAEEIKPQEASVVSPMDILVSSNQQATKTQSTNIFQKPPTVQKQGETTSSNMFSKKPSTENTSNNPQPILTFGNKTNGLNIFNLNKPKEQQKNHPIFDTNLKQVPALKPVVNNLTSTAKLYTSAPVSTFEKPQIAKSITQNSIFSRQNTGRLNFNAANLQHSQSQASLADSSKKTEENKPDLVPNFPPQSNEFQQTFTSNNTSFDNDINKSIFPVPVKKEEPKPAPVSLFGTGKSLFPQVQETPKNIPTFQSTGLFGNQTTENKPSAILFSQPAQQTSQQPQTSHQEASKQSLFSNKLKPINLFNNTAINIEPPKAFNFSEASQGLKPAALFDNRPETKQPEIKPVVKPLFGNAENKMEKLPLFNASMPEKPKVIFPETASGPTQAMFQKRAQFLPVFNGQMSRQPFETSPFETKPNYSFVVDVPSPTPAQKVSAPTTGLFANVSQNSPAQVQKPEPVFPAFSEASQEISRKKSQKDEKKANTTTAIGPGGKTIELPSASVFKSDKPSAPSADLFKASSNNVFGSSGRSASIFSNLGATNESKPSGNLFTQNLPANNIFTQNTGGSLFGNSTNQLFSNQIVPKTGSLFGNLQSSLFNSQSNQNRVVQGQEEGQGEEEDDDAPIQAEDEANPNLSTGKYDYIQTKNFFKQQASKFREGQKETMDGVTISIQQFQNSQDKFLYVRMPNKCIAFCGKFLKNITEARVINNNKRNIEVKKILLCGEKAAGKVELAVVRIGFKEDSIGEKFMKEVENAIQKQK